MHRLIFPPFSRWGEGKIFSLILVTTLILIIPPAFAKPFETHEWQTKNGTHVVFHQAPEVPMLDVNIAFAAGSAYDGTQFGLSALTTRLLDQGNGGLDAGAIADKFAVVGAQYAGASNRDMIVLTLRTLTRPDALKQASDMFALLINHPDFPPDTFLREKDQQLMAIKQNKALPDAIAEDTFYQALYGKHPYAHPTDGYYDSVCKLSVDDVRHFYQQYVVSKNAVIVLVGAIDEATAHRLAERMVGDLRGGQAAASIPEALPLTAEVNIEVPYPAPQSALRLGQLGITHQNSDYFPLQVANYILGGGASMESMFSHELREKRGLTYSVFSEFSPMPGIGPFIISLSTKHRQAREALDLTRETLAGFIKTGPNDQALLAAKHYLTGSFPLSLASNRSIANLLLRIAFYHLPKDFLNNYIDHINAVSTAEVKLALTRQIHPDKLLQITVGRA